MLSPEVLRQIHNNRLVQDTDRNHILQVLNLLLLGDESVIIYLIILKN